jgi:hypothetical protein
MDNIGHQVVGGPVFVLGTKLQENKNKTLH